MGSFQPQRYSLNILTGSAVFSVDKVKQINMKRPEIDYNSVSGIPIKRATSCTEMEVTADMTADEFEHFRSYFTLPEPHDINVYIGDGIISIAKNTFITGYKVEMQYNTDRVLVTFDVRATSIGSPSAGDVRQQRIKQGIAKYKEASE